jgi:hypothetical protein
MEIPFNLSLLVPRICDCKYCEVNPSAMVSHLELEISILANPNDLRMGCNGSGQASFHHCKNCNQLLAVGATLSGVTRGAVNAFLFGSLNQFAQPVSIQPRLLSADEKAKRWAKIWGSLKICHA